MNKVINCLSRGLLFVIIPPPHTHTYIHTHIYLLATKKFVNKVMHFIISFYYFN